MKLSDHRTEFRVIRKLADEFGPLTSTNGELTRNDGSQLPEAAIIRAQAEAENEARWNDIKLEATRRIMLVTKDIITQINIIAWLATAPKDEKLRQTAVQLITWISDMQAAARAIKNKPGTAFRDDKYWPGPPPAAKQLVDRF